jgi:LuxR family maltose regulon positive regulatory protein
MHLLTLLCLYRRDQFLSLAQEYEQKLLALPVDSDFRNYTLGGIYIFWGYMRILMSVEDDNYDFNQYFSKAAAFLSKSPKNKMPIIPIGAWGSAIGSEKAGAPQAFVEAITQLTRHLSACYIYGADGLDYLCRGELLFFQGNLRAAEPLIYHALECTQEHNQFEIMHRSLFYILRTAIAQGDRAKVEKALRDLKTLSYEEAYSRRFYTYDIALGWYYCIIRQHEIIPDWLKGDFSPYVHAYNMEEYGNQIKARYHYIKRNYLPLLAYIKESKQREAILYGLVEMLAMEACIHYQMKNKTAAWASLARAYEAAAPNNIIMPFIELGKDMRTLTAAALREQADHTASGISVPRSWLELVRHKATSYAKSQSMFIHEHTSYNSSNKALSAREQDILSDLYHGFSQSEIANKRSLSINTIKMITKSIYEKLHVHKISDLIRIAAEQRLV